MKLPDPADRRWFLGRKVQPANSDEVQLIATDPLSGADIDAHDQSLWMTYDEVETWAEFWNGKCAPPVLEYGATFMPEIPGSIAAPVITPSEFPKLSPHIMTTNSKSQHEATLGNVAHALSTQTYARIGFDRFRGRVMVAPAGTDAWQPLTDTDMVRLRASLEGPTLPGFAPISKDMMRDALQLVAERLSFDSAITWLNGLVWDGVPRVERFLATHCGAVDDEYTRAVGLYMWTGLAGRVLDPGCQLDMVVAFQSKQGTMKSTGLQMIAPHPDYFTDGLQLHEDDDNFRRLLRGKVVVEIAELAGLSKADVNLVKRVITRRTEEWIEKYQTQPTSFKRRCMLFASTNDEKFLPPDETGQRRWLPVEVTGLNRERIAADRLQLWAEGAAIWRRCGIQWAAAERLAEGRHAKHEQTDVWDAKIAEWLTTPVDLGGHLQPAPCTRPLTIAEVLKGAIGMAHERMDVRAEKRAGRVLRSLGYDVRTVKVSGVPARRWLSPAMLPPK